MRGLYSLLFILLSTSAFAQFNWPEDPEQRKDAETIYSMYNDSYKEGDFDAARPFLDDLIAKYPNLSKAIYINGIKMYKAIRTAEKDEAQKTILAEKVMELYDQRFKNFDGEEKKSIDRKAIDAFTFFIKDQSRTKYILELFSKTYELKGNEAFYPVGRYYMNAAALGYVRKVGLSDDDILDIYEQTIKHIEYQTKKAEQKGQNTKRHNDIKQAIDDKLADMNLIDCDFIIEKLVPKQNEDPSNFDLAKKIFTFAFSGGCTEEDWFLKAALTVYQGEPNFGMAQLLGSKYAKVKQNDEAKKFYAEAVNLTDDNTNKATALKQLASISRIEGDKSEARKYANEAIATDPSLASEMNTMIGDMIMSSSECDKKESQVDDRARFIVAYDYYQKAGDRVKMRQAQNQFPTIGDIFTANKQEGESIFVGCWIQKNAKLTRRPEQ